MTPADTNLEIVRDEAGFLALQPHWESLADRAPTRTPFLTWDWSRLWWQHFKDRFQLRIGVLRDSRHEVVAIAPFVLGRDETGPRKHLRHLTLLGGLGEVFSEGQDFLLTAEDAERLVPRFRELFRALRSEWDIVDMPMLHDESITRPHIQRLLEQTGMAAHRSTPHVDYMLRLPATFEELLGTVSGNRRSDFRSKWKRLMNRHAGRAIIAGQEMPYESSMNALFDVHRLRFENIQSTFVSERAMAFHHALAREWMPAGKCLVTLLEADGVIAAGRYGFIHNNRYWDYQSGFDDRFKALSVGQLAMLWTAEHAISLGLSEYDHLAGDQPHKKIWSTHQRQLIHLEAFNRSSPSSLLFHLVRRLKRLVTKSAPETESPPAAQPSHA